MAIAVDTFDLSLRSTETGQRLTANIYYVDGVTDAVVYEKNGKITAEIYPDVSILPDREAVWREIDRVNRTLKPHEQIGALTLRSEPFEKTATQKIKRNRPKE